MDRTQRFLCRVRILFRRTISLDDLVKLTDDDVRWMVKRVSSGKMIF